MSNLTPEDVDVRLTTVQNKLDGEDLRLWQGLEDEKISRIAGDEANKQFTLIVQDANQGTERRLSTEVIHREEGDLRNIGSLTELAIALSDYRIKTDLEINNEKIARQQLGVDLNTKIDGFVTTWNHQVFTIYQAIQAVQSDVNFKYASMDQRIKKYEDMLQDITTDSIQITMDNGEINMGAWTILSQAREWDLEIIGMFKDYKKETNDNIDEAIKDIESKLPIKEDIIREALEALGNSPIITELQEELSGLEVTIDGVTQTMMEHRTEWQNEMVDLSKVLGDKVDAETTARVEALQTETKARTDEIRKETSTRTEQFRELDDGLTVEIQERIDGDNKSYELIENLKASSEGSLADVYNKIAVNTDGVEANALAIQQVTAEVEVAKDDAGKALVNSATALEQATSAVTQTKAVAERVEGVEVSLGNKVDTTVFNITKAEVERIDGVTKNHTEQLTTIDSTINSMDGIVKGHTTAIEALTVKQTESDGKLLLVTERTTALESSVGGLTTDLNANVQAVNNLKTTVDKQGNDIEAISEDVTSVKARIDNISVGGTNYITSSNTWLGDPLAGAEGITATYSANRDVLFVQAAAGNKGGLTNFLSGGQISDIDVQCNEGDDVIFSVDLWIESGSSVSAPTVYWKTPMSYEPIVLAPGQELRYDGWYRYYQKRKYVKGGHAFHFNFTGMAGKYRFRKPVVEKGTIPSTWTMADADNASAEALQALRAEVNVIDGKVIANTNNLTTLNTKVDNNHSEIVLNYYTKTAANEATANMINSFKSTLSVGGRNLVRNTSLASSGNGWLFQEPLTRKITGEVTITWDVEDLSGAPLAGGIGFNMGNEGLGGYEYFDYPAYTTGKHKITKVLDSKAFTHFGFYSNSNCKISNVKVEDGSVPSAWTPAPEDLEIGGRNLLYNSDFRKGFTYWSNYAATVAVFEEVINNKLTKYAYISNVTASNGGLYMKPVNVPYIAKAGDIMTVSFLGRGDGKLLVGFDDVNTTIQVDTTWRRYSVTLRRKNNDNVIFYCNGATYADICLPKLELGDKATDWTPAPEDNIQEIEAQATAVNSLTTQVSNIDGRVSSTASQVLTLTSTVNDIPQGSGNLLLNSDFSSDTTANSRNPKYWIFAHHVATPDNKVLTDSDMLDWKINAEPSRTLQLHAQGAYDPSLSYYIEAFQSTAITGGKPYQISAYTGAHRTYVYIFAYFFDANGALITNTPLGAAHSTNANEKLGGKNLDGYKRIYQTMTAPVNAVSLRFVIRMLAHNDSYAFITRCMVTELAKESNAPVSWADSAGAAYVSIQQTNQVVDGVKAVSTVSVNNNGFMSGYGLISQLVNGVVVSAFGIDADYFYVGKSMSNAKKPFMVLTTPQVIGGVTYPAGVWMDVAVIANATIGTAHIADASITNAKIKDLNAEKITAGIINADRIGANTITAEKLTVGTGANLWPNPYFAATGAKPDNWAGRSGFLGYSPIFRGNGVQCWGRDHIAPYSTRIPVRPGEQYVIEYTYGHQAGPSRARGLGLGFYDAGGAMSDLSYPPGDTLAALGGGWYRQQATITVPAGNSVSATLFVQIEQAEAEADPTYIAIADVTIRRVNGGELIVNGAITANKLYSTTVSGMFANFGTMTTYKNPANPNGARMVMQGSLLRVYDDNNVMRVRLGLW